MDDEEIIQTDLKFLHQPANCLAALVHVGLGSGYYHLIASYLARADSGFALLLVKSYVVCPGKVVHTHISQIMEAIGITLPRIA